MLPAEFRLTLWKIDDVIYTYYAGKVGVPKQLVIKKDPSSIPGAVSKAGLRLPIGISPFLLIYEKICIFRDSSM